MPVFLRSWKKGSLTVSRFQGSNIHMYFASVCVNARTCLYVRVCVCVARQFTRRRFAVLSFSLSDVKKQPILCTQGANLGPKTKCNFGKTSGMWSTLRELGITGLVCVIQWSKCEQKFTGKFTWKFLKTATTNSSTGNWESNTVAPSGETGIFRFPSWMNNLSFISFVEHMAVTSYRNTANEYTGWEITPLY